MLILRDFLICVPATIFFAILFRVPRRAVLVSAILGAAGYAVYEISMPLLHSAIAGFFIGTLFMSLCSEVLARIMKTPATVFIIPAIIPLVPGIGLYNTMAYLVHEQSDKAAQTGTATLLDIVAMAMALVLTAILTRTVTSAQRRLSERKNRKTV